MTFTCPLQDLHEQYVNCKVNEVYKIPQNASDEFMQVYSDFNISLKLFLLSLASQNSQDERRGYVLNCEKIKFKMLSFHFTYCDFSPSAIRESAVCCNSDFDTSI